MQQLPPKDQAVFRSIVKFYETKQYKKGIKAADSILKKHPEHGETLCMKGLTLSYLEKKEEAYELVRKGVRHDVRSHVCWHVFGLLYRQDRDYFEAVKCYRQALRIDPDNIQILRDLSLLQIHRRDLPGFAETRRKLLNNKPQNRLNWVGYAIAEHLCKNYEFAWTCLDNYENSFSDDEVPIYDLSEFYMYKATIMEEAGKFQDALDCLTKNEKKIVDKLGSLEAKGRLFMYLGKHAEAAEIYEKLVDCNNENHVYILAHMANLPRFSRFWPALPAPVSQVPAADTEKLKELRRQREVRRAKQMPATITSFPNTVHPLGKPIWGWLAPAEAGWQRTARVPVGARLQKRKVEAYEPMVPLTDEEEADLCAYYEEQQAKHPRSDALKRMPLHFLTGDRFRERLDQYLRKGIRKGIPSLFRMMKPFYFQAGKWEVVQELLIQYCTELQKERATFGEWKGSAAGNKVEEEPPSCLLFTLMILAEHYDFIGDTTEAHRYADMAIEHTPTLVEIYTTKANIYRRAGDLESAGKFSEEARSMDLADRFLNCQCVRAMLRQDDTQGGMEKALLFSKEPDSQEAANLYDMQCMWYESAVGRSYRRQRKYGRALKQFTETFKHFADIAEDQFDFHNYCLRKTTLKAYLNMLRMQERLYSHKFYRRAAKDSVNIYVELFDRKAKGEDIGGSAAGAGEEISAAERRRLKHKAKREQKAKDDKATAAGAKPKKLDDDPEGEKLLEKDPMEEASKLVKTLVLYCTQDITTHVLAYDVASRQGKMLLALQALVQLWELAGRDGTHYKLVPSLAHFCFKADLDLKDMHAAVRTTIFSEVAPILGSSEAFPDLAALRGAAAKMVDRVDARIRGEDLSVVEVMSGLKCLRHAGRDCKKFLEEEWQPKGPFALKECQKMLGYLESEFGRDSAAWTTFGKRCGEVFPSILPAAAAAA